MDVTSAIARRATVRRYRGEEVPVEKLRAVLEAGRRAPSWTNIQPWHFVLVRAPETKRLVGEVCLGQRQVEEAPACILVFGDLGAWDMPRYKAHLVELLVSRGVPDPEGVVEERFAGSKAYSPALAGREAVLARTLEQVGIAVGYMTLEAENQGLGCCVLGAIANELTEVEQAAYARLRKRLGVPEGFCLVSVLTLGFPLEKPEPTPRKAFNEVVSSERFGVPLT